MFAILARLAESGRASAWYLSVRLSVPSRVYKLVFHGADTDTDTDFLADILARMSACRRTCHIGITSGNRASDVSERILARMSV